MLNKTPSMAISVRFEHRSESQLRSTYRHDLRKGPQPKYVDQVRLDQNSTIVPYAEIPELKRTCKARRAQRATRAMKLNAAIGSTFIVTFGAALQEHVTALPVDRQNELYRAVSDAMADRLGTEVAGLVAHRDETAPHAHGLMPAYAADGRPVSKIITPKVASELQQIAEDTAREFLPMIGARRTKAARLVAGEDHSAIYHRSVKQLHEDLPAEVAAMEAKLSGLREQEQAARDAIEKNQRLVEKLEAKAQLSEKEAKRFQTYSRRIETHQAALVALSAEIEKGTIFIRENGKIVAANVEPLAAAPELRPAVKAAAEAGSRLRDASRALEAEKEAQAVERRKLEAERKALIEERRELQADQRELVSQQTDLLQEKAELAEEWRSFRAWVEDQKKLLREAMSRVARFFKRADLPSDARAEALAIADDAKAVLASVDPFSAEPASKEADRLGL